MEVGFILVGKDATSLKPEEVECLNALSEGVRLAQEIVDMPTNHMHTDAFLDVSTHCIMYYVEVGEMAQMSQKLFPILPNEKKM